MTRIAYTASVRGVQERNGSAHAMPRHLDGPDEPDPLGPVEQQFIAERDRFSPATVSETGWPCIQHRRGPSGFLHVLDEHTPGFLFLMDYACRTRLKLFGRARRRQPGTARHRHRRGLQLELPRAHHAAPQPRGTKRGAATDQGRDQQTERDEPDTRRGERTVIPECDPPERIPCAADTGESTARAFSLRQPLCKTAILGSLRRGRRPVRMGGR
ncbi:hypothetical protein [Streptomyces griseofuscus]|uniref:hypothetical protein n=1 Tax=Streptomyces griseofuscus TaxID=146922 RepID=UPI001C0F3A26|nr:hypothetical protein [Streptomyces griseofuscus]